MSSAMTSESTLSIFSQWPDRERLRDRPAAPTAVTGSPSIARMKLRPTSDELDAVPAPIERETSVEMARPLEPTTTQRITLSDGRPAIARMTLGPRAPSGALSPEAERAILDALASSPRAGETVALAFQRIEHQVGLLFAKLTVLQARALHRRLSQPVEGDALAARFGRLVRERRLRLLAFLGDARRREALARLQAG